MLYGMAALEKLERKKSMLESCFTYNHLPCNFIKTGLHHINFRSVWLLVKGRY